MKGVLELIRVSTAAQAANDRASIPAQRTVNRRTCHNYGLEIVRSIEIADVSGASVLLAPEIQELIRLMQSPSVHGVVAREFSRLIRPDSFADFALLQAFSDSKTILYLPEGPIDFNNKTGRLMGTIRAAIAGMERTEILERVWTAKEEKRRRGELAQSSAVLPYGVGYEKGRGFYYEPEAELVRAAFREFLSGNQSYAKLAQIVGVTPRGMHIILRNPIWTGWRIIDQKRDLSAAGKYTSINGRQSDRRKVDRAPEDVIRVQVIDKPMITQEEFYAVQEIMDIKQRRHWRSEADYPHRFTYNSFLTCSQCGRIIHSVFSRRDYYVCKGRRTTHSCQAPYMRREGLEEVLDELFAEQLTRPGFIESCVGSLRQGSKQKSPRPDVARLTAEIRALERKRERVIDSFVDGTITQAERDLRLKSIDGGIGIARASKAQQGTDMALDTGRLIDALAPLIEWPYWTRDQKRSVLSALVPDIRVAHYKVESLGLNPTLFSHQDSHGDMGSSLQPA
jgi:DNA invertase Pin-like site-specific DNA recombinase